MKKWKRIVPVMTGAMLAAYLGALMASPAPSGYALAAAAGARNSDGRIVMATTGAKESGDRNGNRVVVVDTVNKKIMVYRVYSKFMRLIAVRTYNFDLEWGVTPDLLNGSGFTFKQAEGAALQMRAAREKAGKRWRLRGREMVVTCDTAIRGSQNRVVLLNPELKTILVYRLDGNSIWLVSARRYDQDQMLLYTDPLKGQGFTYQQVEKMVRDAEKRHELAGRGKAR